jgi:hypothetical protein
MRINRTMALVGGGLLATWLASAASYRDAAPPAQPASAVRANPSPSPIEEEAARLGELLAPRPALRPTGRNPFRFAPRPAPSIVRPARPSVEPPAIAPPPETPVKLVGIAERAAAAGADPDRTAILTVEGRLVLAKAGEAVEARYRVERVGADAAELTDLSTDSRITLALER